MTWAGQGARKGEMRNVYKILVGKLEKNRSLWKPRHRWEDNIKLILYKKDVRTWTGFMWFRTGSSGGFLQRW